MRHRRKKRPDAGLTANRAVTSQTNGTTNGHSNGHTNGHTNGHAHGHAPGADAPDLVIDTSKMNRGQAAALEIAEAARDASEGTSFAAQLFLGHYQPELVTPFPVQTDADRAIGDALVAEVTTLLHTHLDPELVDETREIPEVVVEGLQRLGVLRMKVPTEYGGLGVSQVNYNRVIQAIASYCGSTAVLVSAHQSIGVPQPLKLFGTEAQKAKYLPMISAGALSAFALTEPGVGSDPARMTTTATPTDDGRGYILNGEKLWTTNGPIADLLVVMAQTPPKVKRGRERRQITAFIVEADTPGVEVAHRCDFMGLRGIQNGVIRFHDVRVPAENVLWGEGLGLKLALRTLNTGRLTLPAACAGMAKQCLSIARRWGEERVQWGQAIGRHEAGRDKIADLAATTFAMEAVTWLTSHWADEGRDIRIEAGMAKLFASESAWRLVDTTMQLRGGRGYERATSLAARGETPFPVERMMRDCRINTIIEGTSDIMRLFLAREALDPHLRGAADLLRPHAPLKARLGCGLRRAAFYAGWYPRMLVGKRLPIGDRAWGDLATHIRFADRASKRLARSLFHAMVRFGPKLEAQQVLLGLLMDIGTELFAMTATLSYAKAAGQSDDAEALADCFCRAARYRIRAMFRDLKRGDRRRRNSVAGRVLDGEFQWLEAGITPCVRPAPDGAAEESNVVPVPSGMR